MSKRKYRKKCPFCVSYNVRKNGKTSAGLTRYRCNDCGASHTIKRPGSSHGKQLEEHVAYFTTPAAKATPITNRRTWDRKHEWCWNHIPSCPYTGEIYDCVFIDGTYFKGYNLCLLLAVANGYVVGWLWCKKENKASYIELLSNIAPPDMVVTDGHKGSLQAVKQAWPGTKMQRCLLHVYRNTIRDTTLNPKIPMHKALLKLSRELVKVKTIENAQAWEIALNRFYTTFRHVLKEKTYKNDISPKQLPSWIRPYQKWWWTHRSARSAYFRFYRLKQNRCLWSFIEENQPKASTTNPVESINSQLKQIVREHKGMKKPHLVYAITWKLYQLTEVARKPSKILKTLVPVRVETVENDPLGTTIYGTGIDQYNHYEETGFSIRKNRK